MGYNVNISDKEARAGDPFGLDAGKYRLRITDVEVKTVAETKTQAGEEVPNKNAGKPYYVLNLECVEGPMEGRRDVVRAMLFDGALYTIVAILKALDAYEVKDGSLEVPDPEWFQGKELIGRKGIKRGSTDLDWTGWFSVDDAGNILHEPAPKPTGSGKATSRRGI